MLIEFTVGNFRSFKDPVTFSMVAANIRSQDKSLDESNVFTVDGSLKLLKSAAIYGANASGKSNVGKALDFLRRFVLNSSKNMQAEEPIPVEPFRLSTEMRDKPSSFEIVFLAEGTRYRYGFAADARRIVSEWLYFVPSTQEANLFERDGDDIRVKPRFKEGRGLKDKTRDNALFLSVAAQFNGTIAKRLLHWFQQFNIISGLKDMDYWPFSVTQLEKEISRKDLVQFIRNLDLNINDVRVKTTILSPEISPPDMSGDVRDMILSVIGPGKQFEIKNVYLSHNVYGTAGKGSGSEDFELERDESEGTKKLIALSGPLMDILKTGRVLFVDELDARLHPLMTRAIISLFHSPETNPNNAQLIFATHDTNLLSKDIFRRDQIWFTEKDRQGATRLYSLVEFKVRNDASFETNYIQGRFGAIPFLGDFQNLLGDGEVEATSSIDE